ncbi:MAG: hypothetical protein CMF17_11405 [Idiomarinaceae bacterium]|nr:hypothetical protein [Idiomarinaceae bacterium]
MSPAAIRDKSGKTDKGEDTTVRHQGQLHQWNDEKGFGFVQIDRGRKAFVHISAFMKPARRPQEGDRIAFDVETDSTQRLQATRVKLMGVRRKAGDRALKTPMSPGRPVENPRPATLPYAPLAILLLLPVMALLFPELRTLTAALAALNLITFMMYWKDKSAARKQQRRVPEANLHLASLLGGWPGAWMAQHIFRHKTVKTSFRVTFWLSVVFNISGGLILARQLAYL